MIPRIRLPATARAMVRVITLCEMTDISPSQLAMAVQGDPGCVVSLLAASGYPRRYDRTDYSVRSSIERLGVGRALHTCLTSDILQRDMVGNGDCIRHWRCALLTAAYARAVATRLRRTDVEIIQTAAVLRNVRELLTACRCVPYNDTGAHGIDWLHTLGISSAICDLIHRSLTTTGDEAADCLTLGSRMAEVWLSRDWERSLTETRAIAQDLFGAIPDLCAWVFGISGPQARDLEDLLKLRFPSRKQADALRLKAQFIVARLTL